jgi:hypothetical protein
VDAGHCAGFDFSVMASGINVFRRNRVPPLRLEAPHQAGGYDHIFHR